MDYTNMDVDKQLMFHATFKEGRRAGRHEAVDDFRDDLLQHFCCDCNKAEQRLQHHREGCRFLYLSRLCQAHHDIVTDELGPREVPNAIVIACALQDNAWEEVDEHPIGRTEGAAKESAAAVDKAKADARFREVGLDPVAIDASRAADDRREDARLRELEAKCPGTVLGPPQVYRIVYRTVAGAKPTFIHVRAESPTRALMAFIDGTSPLQVSAVKLDNEYGGPLLNERENFWPANDAKLVAQENTGDNDEDDTETGPVVREGA